MRRIDRVLRAGALQLVKHDLIGIDADPICQQEAIGQHVGQLIANSSRVAVRTPLEALEKFASFDDDALRKVLRRVELSPITFGDEG